MLDSSGQTCRVSPQLLLVGSCSTLTGGHVIGGYAHASPAAVAGDCGLLSVAAAAAPLAELSRGTADPFEFAWQLRAACDAAELPGPVATVLVGELAVGSPLAVAIAVCCVAFELKSRPLSDSRDDLVRPAMAASVVRPAMAASVVVVHVRAYARAVDRDVGDSNAKATCGAAGELEVLSALANGDGCPSPSPSPAPLPLPLPLPLLVLLVATVPVDAATSDSRSASRLPK